MLGFLVAAAAGYLTPQLEDAVAAPLIKAVRGHLTIEPQEKRLVAFMVAMIAAGIGAVLLDSGSPFWVICGGILGYFATRLYAAGRKLLDGRGN